MSSTKIVGTNIIELNQITIENAVAFWLNAHVFKENHEVSNMQIKREGGTVSFIFLIQNDGEEKQ